MEQETEALQDAIDVDGGSMPVYLCRPAAEGRYAGIIVVHEIFGVVPHIEDVACRFAAQGYVTLAPDLLWQIGPPPQSTDRAVFMHYRQSMDDRQILASLDAALAYLREQPEVEVAHIGIVGFCMGGYYAFLEAAQNPSLGACVDFYGAPLTGLEPPERHPRSLLQAARELRVPFLGLFGEEDPSIPVDRVRELEGILRETGVPFEVHIYPGAGHAFFNDTRESYRRHAAEDAWPRALQFFAQHLKK